MKIRANHLTKKVSLPNQELLTILEDISLDIESGEKLGIIGVSGSGKSTLLGLLAGLDLSTTGSVFWEVDNKTIFNLNLLSEDKRAELRLNQAGFVFQNFELLSSYTALENVLLPLELLGMNNSSTTNLTERAKHCLAEVGLSHRLNHYPNQLSGGEQQRVAIARAFSVQPRILFADEPTGNLDQKTGFQIIRFLYELNEEYKTTLVCVTHDPALSEICDRTLHIADGRILNESLDEDNG